MPTFRGLDANLLEPIGFLHGPHNRLDQLLDLLIQPAHVSVLLRGLLIHLHGFDSAVIFGRQGVEDEIRVLVNADEIGGLQLVRVDEANER